MSKNILIVSYTFPPSPGIGGRRWAKFAKYLSKEGYDIRVLTSETVIQKKSPWEKDVEGIKVITLPFNFPKIIAFPEQGFYGKVLYRINLLYLKLKDKGNYFDRTIFWEEQIQEKISEIIARDKINCVIVTSGPFRLSLYVTRVKKKFPSVKFIVDFRDLWTQDVEITSFASLSLARQAVEKSYEKETIQLADKVLSVAPELNNHFSLLTNRKKFAVIPNGYDPDDFMDLPVVSQNNSDIIQFVFTGTLYINLEYILNPFFKALSLLKTNRNDLFKKIQFEFIGHFPATHRELLESYKISEAFKFTEHLPLKQVYAKIANSHFCMLFLNNVYNFALSTKFCEYISQRKKILVVSNTGPASRFIQENEIGYWINPETAYDDLLKIAEDAVSNKNYKWDSAFDINRFSLPEITAQLAGIIEEPLSTENDDEFI